MQAEVDTQLKEVLDTVIIRLNSAANAGYKGTAVDSLNIHQCIQLMAESSRKLGDLNRDLLENEKVKERYAKSINWILNYPNING